MKRLMLYTSSELLLTFYIYAVVLNYNVYITGFFTIFTLHEPLSYHFIFVTWT